MAPRLRKTEAEVPPISDVSILHIEDDRIDAEWAQRALSDYKAINFKVEWVDTLLAAKNALSKKEFDLIVLDLNLPDGFGLDLFKDIKRVAGNAAIVLFTGTIEEKVAAVEALDIGAQDYLSKDDTDQTTFIKSIRFALERNKLIQTLNQKNKELSEFSHVLSHDLKQPLTAIKLTLGNLNIPSALLAAKDILNNRVDNMTQTIDALLQYSACGGEIVNKKKIDLSLCINSALGNLKVDVEKENAKIDVAKLPAVTCNNQLVSLLFQNLISNAIKFKKTKTDPKVSITSQEEKDCWIIAIKDNGMGIDKDKEKNKIFEPFTRSEKSLGIPGYGIGLATCKKIVESHGGEIWYENNPDTGTTFYFKLPKDV